MIDVTQILRRPWALKSIAKTYSRTKSSISGKEMKFRKNVTLYQLRQNIARIKMSVLS
jgi:hypothetical protein